MNSKCFTKYVIHLNPDRLDLDLDLDHKNKNKKNDISFFKEDMILLCKINWKIKKLNILKNIWTKI